MALPNAPAKKPSLIPTSGDQANSCQHEEAEPQCPEDGEDPPQTSDWIDVLISHRCSFKHQGRVSTARSRQAASKSRTVA